MFRLSWLAGRGGGGIYESFMREGEDVPSSTSSCCSLELSRGGVLYSYLALPTQARFSLIS
jgi:hypothetical protein